MVKVFPFHVFAAALLGAALLCGCVSNFSRNIVSMAEEHITADAGGQVRVGGETLLPEYSYRRSLPYICMENIPDLVYIRGLHHTGGYRVLQYDERGMARMGERRPAPGAPGPAASPSAPLYPPMMNTRGEFELRRRAWYPAMVVLAAPAAVLDLGLTLVLAPPYYVYRQCGGPPLWP